jgi:hypothetical protein
MDGIPQPLSWKKKRNAVRNHRFSDAKKKLFFAIVEGKLFANHGRGNANLTKIKGARWHSGKAKDKIAFPFGSHGLNLKFF